MLTKVWITLITLANAAMGIERLYAGHPWQGAASFLMVGALLYAAAVARVVR